MTEWIIGRAAVTPIRDDRYATLWEMGGPDTGLSCLSVAFVTVDPGKTSPLHYHQRTEEVYMIARGRGLMYIGNKRQEIIAGDCVSIPVGIVHAVGNPGPDPLEMWVATSPQYCEEDDFEVEN